MSSQSFDSWEFWQDLENRRKMFNIDLGAKAFAYELSAILLINGVDAKNINAETGAWDNPVSRVSFEIGSVGFSLEIEVNKLSDKTFDAVSRINVWSDIRGPLNRIFEVVKKEDKSDIPLDAKEVKKLFASMYRDLYDIIKNNQIQNPDLKSLVSNINLPFL
jgi:hypothetical protein